MATYESMSAKQRDAWWLRQIHQAAATEEGWSGDAPPDPVEVAQRLVDLLEDTWVPAEPADLLLGGGS